MESQSTCSTLPGELLPLVEILVPYDQLPEEETVYDRDTCVETLRFILAHGFKIERTQRLAYLRPRSMQGAR